MFGHVGGTTFYEDGVIADDQEQSRNKGTMQMRKLGSNATGASGYNNIGGPGATIS